MKWREQAEYLSAFGGESAVSLSLENVTCQKPTNDCSGVCYRDRVTVLIQVELITVSVLPQVELSTVSVLHKWSLVQWLYCTSGA